MSISDLYKAAMADAVGSAAVHTGGEVPLSYDRGLWVWDPGLGTEDIAKTIPNARSLGEYKWKAPANYVQLQALRAVYGTQLCPDESAESVAKMLDQHCEYLGRPVDGLDPRLKPFQVEGVSRLVRHYQADQGLGLFDDMGLGKTVQVLAALNVVKASALVVCPPAVIDNWEREASVWYPGAKVFLLRGTATQRRKVLDEVRKAQDYYYYQDCVVVASYDIARRHTSLRGFPGSYPTEKEKQPKELDGLHFDVVVFDEAHRLKNRKAKRTMAARALTQNSTAWMLTGTPNDGNPDSTYPLLSMIDEPSWGSITQYRELFCDIRPAYSHAGIENHGIRRDRQEAFDKAFSAWSLRRTKESVLPQLPERLPTQIRTIPMTPKQRKVYRELADDMLSTDEGSVYYAMSPLVLMGMLRQVAAAAPVPGTGEPGKIGELDAYESNKVDELINILEEADDEPVVVFSESRRWSDAAAERLRGLGISVGQIVGGINDKQEQVDRFQAGKTRVLLCTYGAAAEGVTLTRSSIVVLAEVSWSHTKNGQAVDRIYRIGQTRGVQTIILESEGTVDRIALRAVSKKEDITQQIVRDAGFKKVIYGKA